jgi:hypothetical protein
MNIFKTNKNQLKFDYEIKLHHLTKIPIRTGVVCYATWKCGSRNSGETKRKLVKDKTAIWDESFKFTSAMAKKNHRYRTKYLNLIFYEVSKEKKKSISIGELKLNLADYTSIYNEELTATKVIGVKINGTDEEGKLKISIKSFQHTSGQNGYEFKSGSILSTMYLHE